MIDREAVAVEMHWTGHRGAATLVANGAERPPEHVEARMFRMDMTEPEGPRPKRGDLLQTSVGDKRERTWIILSVRKVRSTRGNNHRFEVDAVRWWELEPDARLRLHTSAERNGGQHVFWFYRYRQVKRRGKFKDFEALMGAGR